MSINERVREVRKALNLSQEQFGERIGMVKSGISNIENGSRAVNERIIKLICSEFSVNEEWLRTGEGEMFTQQPNNDIIEAFLNKINASDIERAFVKAYVKLNEFQRKVFQDYLKEVQQELQTKRAAQEKRLTYEFANEIALYEKNLYEVPLYGKVAGGAPILATEEQGKTIKTNIKCDCALQLVGDSMAPLYNDGDILLIKRQPWLDKGDIGIVLIMEAAEIAEATCKKFYQQDNEIILRSINPVYEDIRFKDTDVMVFGKVVGKWQA